MAKPNEIYSRLSKTRPKALNKLEVAHSEDKGRFTKLSQDLVHKIGTEEFEYESEMRNSKKSAGNSDIESSVVHALRAKILRHEILARRSSLLLMRANEFYHSTMIRMIRDARLGIELDEDKLKIMLPPELKDVLLESIKGTRTEGLLEPILDEAKRSEN